MKGSKLAFTGGGSGGHLQPAIAVITHITQNPRYGVSPADLCYIGSAEGIEAREIPALGIRYHAIPVGKFRRPSLGLSPGKILTACLTMGRNLLDLGSVGRGVFAARAILARERPNRLFSTGGFVSVPVVIAAGLLGIPITIHEQTTTVGLANRIAGWLASEVLLSYPKSVEYFPAEKCQVTGLPIREFLFAGSSESLRQRFGFGPDPILYVTGGANGSKLINDHLSDLLPDLLPQMQIIHQCGRAEGHDFIGELNQRCQSLPADLRPRYIVQEFFREEIADILRGASLLLGRSGAGTVAETIALGVPSLFIPLPGATMNEQFHNADFARALGGAEIIEERELNRQRLRETLVRLVRSESREKMVNALKKSEFINGVEKIAKILIPDVDGENG